MAIDFSTIEWRTEQLCAECGEGAYASKGGHAICTECGHENPMDLWNLGEGERFEWHTVRPGSIGPTLHVTAYAVTGDES